ncbi:MAG: hypothetical protein ACI84C_001832, partial [Flavobacteriales bacterium]
TNPGANYQIITTITNTATHVVAVFFLHENNRHTTCHVLKRGSPIPT